MWWCQPGGSLVQPGTRNVRNTNNINHQETNQPAYVAVLAAQTTHRALLAGEREVGPVLCDRAAQYIDEAVR